MKKPRKSIEEDGGFGPMMMFAVRGKNPKKDRTKTDSDKTKEIGVDIMNLDKIPSYKNYKNNTETIIERVVGDIINIDGEEIKVLCFNNIVGDVGFKNFYGLDENGCVINAIYEDEISDYILEKNIFTITGNIPIRVMVDTTYHAEERKFRHGEDNLISDSSIVSSINKALKSIALSQLKGIDDIGQKYWIYDKSQNYLNVIGVLKRKGYDLVFVVITVMYKKGFIGSSDTKKIVVN